MYFRVNLFFLLHYSQCDLLIAMWRRHNSVVIRLLFSVCRSLGRLVVRCIHVHICPQYGFQNIGLLGMEGCNLSCTFLLLGSGYLVDYSVLPPPHPPKKKKVKTQPHIHKQMLTVTDHSISPFVHACVCMLVNF